MANGFCRPFWKLGSGHYGKTLGQNSRDAIDRCQDVVLSFVDTIPVERSSCFTLADYGTTDGYASMNLFERIIGQVKEKRGEDFPVQIIYEDQRGNDFPSLFMWLADESSYMRKFRQVFPMATDVSFYNQCVPDGTCDVIFASMATHWLESLDGITYKGGVFYSSLKEDEEETRNRVNQLADRDWTKFLRLRARELKSGGLLVVVGIRVLSTSDLPLQAYGKGGSDEEEHNNIIINNDDNNDDDDRRTRGGPEEHHGEEERKKRSGLTLPPGQQGLPNINIEKELDAAWRRLRDEGRITPEEFEECKVECYWRSVEKATSPLKKDPSLAGEGGLALVHYGEVIHQFVPKQRWQEKLDKEGVDDRDFFARMMTSAHRTWSDGVFRKSLSDMRSAEEKDAIMDALYTSFEERLKAMNPADFNAYYAISTLVLRKR